MKRFLELESLYKLKELPTMKSYFTIFICTLSLMACTSVKKYNQAYSAMHSPEELREDVDAAYRHLITYQPKYDLYISKEDMKFSFDSLKESFTSPMNSKDFAYALKRVIGKIGQGHNKVYIPNKKFTKKEFKEFKNYSFDLNKMYFDIANDTVYVNHITGEDSIYLKAQVLEVNDEPISDIIDRYLPYVYSDGYNQTFRKKIIAQRFGSYYYGENGRPDSVKIKFQKNDSVWTQNFKRYLKKDKKKEEIRDSIKSQLKDINNSQQRFVKENDSKANDKVDKKKIKAKRNYDFMRGYEPATKLYNREFSFIGEDSTVGYLKIRSFSKYNYKKFYDETFQKLDSAKTKNLIIDVRNNLGGRLDEIDYIYSYLIDEDYIFLEPSQVSTRSSLYKSYVGNTHPILSSFFILSAPFTYPYLLSKTSKDKEGNIYYKFKNSKTQEPKENNFKGNIYYILNGASFSASSVLATALDSRDNVIFVGEESGGDYNGTTAGMLNSKTLPNTKVKIGLGILHITNPNKREEIGRGLYPDMEITSSYQDFVNDKDAELEWILEDISSQSKKN